MKAAQKELELWKQFFEKGLSASPREFLRWERWELWPHRERFRTNLGEDRRHDVEPQLRILDGLNLDDIDMSRRAIVEGHSSNKLCLSHQI